MTRGLLGGIQKSNPIRFLRENVIQKSIFVKKRLQGNHNGSKGAKGIPPQVGTGQTQLRSGEGRGICKAAVANMNQARHEEGRLRADLMARFFFRPHALNTMVLILTLATRSHSTPTRIRPLLPSSAVAAGCSARAGGAGTPGVYGAAIFFACAADVDGDGRKVRAEGGCGEG